MTAVNKKLKMSIRAMHAGIFGGILLVLYDQFQNGIMDAPMFKNGQHLTVSVVLFLAFWVAFSRIVLAMEGYRKWAWFGGQTCSCLLFYVAWLLQDYFKLTIHLYTFVNEPHKFIVIGYFALCGLVSVIGLTHIDTLRRFFGNRDDF